VKDRLKKVEMTSAERRVVGSRPSGSRAYRRSRSGAGVAVGVGVEGE
jgi:hypothetical protein